MSLFLIVLLLCVGIARACTENLTCRPWNVEGVAEPILWAKSCYVVTEIERTWHEAKDFCEKHDGYLVKITSESEHAVARGGIEKNCFFIGLNNEQDGIWRWTDGSEITYDIWGVTYFGWLTKRWSKCGATCRNPIFCHLYQWEKKRCSSPLKFICEYDAVFAEPKAKEEKSTTGDILKCPIWPNEEPLQPFLFEGKCYIRTEFRRTWQQGRDFCLKHGGDLAIIDSQEEHDTVKGPPGDATCYSIGLTKKSGGSWRWVDGSAMTFSKVEDGLLDFVLQIWRECGAMCSDAACPQLYNWILKSCGDKSKVICEYDPVVIKAPPVRRRRRRERRQTQRTSFRREGNFPNHRLLSEPDLQTTAPFSTACSRICMERVTPCAIFNFHRATKTCLGFSTNAALRGKMISTDEWEVWEAVVV